MKESDWHSGMASLNGTTAGGWTSTARLLEQAGADGVELHLYHAASDATLSGAEVERQMLQIVREVKHELRIPIAIKLSPFFTSFGHFARELNDAGADGLVLFTRFHKVDIDVLELEVIRKLQLSDSSDLQLRLLGTAALAGRVKGSLAITGGVHTGLDVVKATMAGAMLPSWFQRSFETDRAISKQFGPSWSHGWRKTNGNPSTRCAAT